MLKILEYLAIGSAIAFAICLVALMFFYGSPSTAPQPPQQQHAEENKTVTSQSEGEKPFWQKATTDPVAAFTLFLVIFTAILSAVGVIQLKMLTRAETVAEKTAQAAKDSADIARDTLAATNRPWISIPEISLASGLTYSAEGEARVKIKFILKNVGKSPAVNIHLRPEFRLIFGDPRPVLKEICDAERAGSPEVGSFGFVLFPDEWMMQEHSLPISKQAIDEFHAKQIHDYSPPADQPDPPKFLITSLVGCVDYKFTFAPGHHQTGFVAEIRKRDANGAPSQVFQVAEGDVPIANMALVRSYIGGFAD